MDMGMGHRHERPWGREAFRAMDVHGRFEAACQVKHKRQLAEVALPLVRRGELGGLGQIKMSGPIPVLAPCGPHTTLS